MASPPRLTTVPAIGVRASAGSGGITELTDDVLAGPGSGTQPATVVGLQGNPVDPATPATGDVLTWDGAAWIPSGPVGGTRTYGTAMLVYPFVPMPTTEVDVEARARFSGGNVEIVRDFDAYYSRCQVRLRWADQGDVGTYTREHTQVFANRAAIVAYINANTSVTGGQSDEYVTVEVFDVQESQLVPPAKVYGQNRVYATLVRRDPYGGRYHGYWTGSAIAADSSGGFKTPVATALKALWDSLGYPNVLPPPISWGPDEFSVFWVSRNRLRRYDMPQFNASSLSIPFGAGRDRKVYNVAVGAIVDRAASFDSTIYNAAAAQQATYVGVSPTGSITPFDLSQSWREMGLRLSSGDSILIGYPLIRDLGGGIIELSVFVKPVGVDVFSFESFDPTRYQLEAVGTLRNDFRPKVRPLSLSQAAPSRTAGFTTVPQLASAFGLQPNRFQSAFAGSHGYRSGSIRFQYRDLDTGRISSLSTAAIKPVWRQRARPFCLMVRNSTI